MFILKKGHQPGVYVPLRALFLVFVVKHRLWVLVRTASYNVYPESTVCF